MLTLYGKCECCKYNPNILKCGEGNKISLTIEGENITVNECNKHETPPIASLRHLCDNCIHNHGVTEKKVGCTFVDRIKERSIAFDMHTIRSDGRIYVTHCEEYLQ